jgi:hypothetical protein
MPLTVLDLKKTWCRMTSLLNLVRTLFCSMLASFSEGLLLGEAAGLDPETILEVTNFCQGFRVLGLRVDRF